MTIGPDLIGGAVVSSTSIAFAFDEAVLCNGVPCVLAGGGVTAFNAIQPNGVEINPVAVTRSNQDASIVVATFGNAADVSNAVGISVEFGGVVDTSPAATPNADDEAGLQSVTFQSGRTGIADLVSVSENTNELNQTVTVFTFDQNLASPGPPFGAYVVAGNEGDFMLCDLQATCTAAAGGTGAVSGNRVIFTNGWTQVQVNGAVVGTVTDVGGPVAVPPNVGEYTDGDAGVTHAPDVT